MKHLLILVFGIHFSLHAAVKEVDLSTQTNQVLNLFKDLEKLQVSAVKKQVLALGGKAVPALINVMKDSKFTDMSRWVATFLLGRIMGTKAGPFIAKFLEHHSWVMRMASLKTLLALGENKYGDKYAQLLRDESIIVRTQALENIRRLKLKSFAPQVWAMLYEKDNYYAPQVKGKEANKKRTHIIRLVIKTVGELSFAKAEEPLLTMIQKEKYRDIYSELDYALTMISNKKSPSSGLMAKQLFWKRYAQSRQTL